MSRLDALLAVQDLDTRLDQIEYRTHHLPEDVQIAEVDIQLATIASQRSAVAAQHHDLVRSQKGLEDEIAGLSSRVALDNARLYDGTITSPKEASALQDEIASLGRRQSSLEDEVLVLMEQVEPLSIELAQFDSASAGLDEQRGRLEAARTVALAELEAERTAVEAERAPLAASVDEALLARYDKARSRARGSVVIGRIEAGRCTACSLGVSAVFLDRAKAAGPDEIHQCEECGVMLVWAGTTA